MRCEQADSLMMKYMDRNLSEGEAERLHLHLRECESCQADFLAYDQMVEVFIQETAVTVAWELPAAFDQEVMAKIEALGALPNCYTKTDNMLCVFWGGFSALIGLGFGVALNKDAIAALLADSPEGAWLTSFFAPVSQAVSGAVDGAVTAFNQAMTQAAGYVAASRWVLLAVFACLAVGVFVAERRKKSTKIY